ncbi:MAG: DNA translocase FtsK [Spirochaetales bacterium]|nr:DNA translocase FtsK [Spirochaetales bacterium]
MSVRQKTAYHWVPVALIAAVGALILFSLILTAYSDAGAVAFPVDGTLGLLIGAFLLSGRFLFNAFSWAAFYVPVYLLLNAALIGRFRVRRMIVLILTLLPFLTLALLCKIVFAGTGSPGPVVAGLEALAGSTGSAVFTGAFALTEILLITAAAYVLGKKARASRPAGFPPARQTSPPRKMRYLLPEPVNGAGGDGNGSGRKKAFLQPVKVQPIAAGADRLPSPALSIDPPADDERGPIKTGRKAETDRSASSAPSRAKKKEPLEGERPARKAGPPKARGRYRIAPESVLKDYGREDYQKLDAVTQRLSEALKATLEEFNIQAEVTGIQKGPVITMFEILPAPGVKLSKIVNLADNIALRLAASRVRIVAPIPGKQAVGIEVPNKRRSIVSLRETLSAPDFADVESGLPIALGKDIMGNVVVADLTQMPHLLIAGATGSGKSVCVNSIICSILFKQSPEQARLILIDPKIVELKYFNDIPHLLTPVITEPKKAYQALQYCIAEMERRYALLDALCARDIAGFNAKAAKKTHTTEPLPHIIVVIDEFADLIAVTGKDMESTLARLAAMSRAVGIHIVLATQRPSIDVITGLIKANIPARIAFMVAGKFDSRIIIDQVGAEKLLGQGDMLFLSAQNPFPVRIQGAFISDREVEDLVAEVKTYGEPDYIDDEIFIEEESDFDIGLGEADPMFDKALEIVMAAGKASTSYVQRKLKIGYNRAARLVEEMEIRGIVGPANGSKPRDIIHVPSKARD